MSCEVVIKAPGEVPRSQGKAVRVQGFAKEIDALTGVGCALTTSARICRAGGGRPFDAFAPPLSLPFSKASMTAS